MKHFNLFSLIDWSKTHVVKGFRTPILGGTKTLLLALTLLCGVTNAWGSSVSSQNNSNDIKDGSIKLSPNHARFYLNSCSGWDNGGPLQLTAGYNLGTLGSSGLSSKGEREYSLTWEVDQGCSIKVTKISFDLHAYNSSCGLDGDDKRAKGIFNGVTKTVGNNVSSSTNFSAEGTFTSGTKINLTSNRREWDVRIQNISITYTITPDAPVIKSTTMASVDVTVDKSNPKTITLSDYFSTTDGSDFNPLLTGNVNPNTNCVCANNQFYATAAGIYTIKAKIAAGDCHGQSDPSSSALTVTVNRLDPNFSMSTGNVDVTTDKSNPKTIDLNGLVSKTIGDDGAVSYTLLSGPTAKDGTPYTGNCELKSNTFHAWVGGEYHFKAELAQTSQYNSATVEDFVVNVNRLDQNITFLENGNPLDDDPWVGGEILSATAVGAITMTATAGGENVTISNIDGNDIVTINEEPTSQTTTIHAVAAQTDLYNQTTADITLNISPLKKQYITLNQKFTGLKTTDSSKRIKISDYTTIPEERKSAVTFALSSNAADQGVSLSQESDDWYLNYSDTAAKDITLTASLAGVTDVYLDAIPVQTMVKVTDPTALCEVNDINLESNVHLQSGTFSGAGTHTYYLTMPNQVTLAIKKSERESWLSPYNNGLSVKFYNASGTQVGSTQTINPDDAADYQAAEGKTKIYSDLDKSITSMVVSTDATKGYDITACSYTRPEQSATKSATELDFGDFRIGSTTTSKTLTFTVSYTNTPVEITCNNANYTITPSSFGDCEQYSTAPVTVNVTYNARTTLPAGYTNDNVTLYLKDHTGQKDFGSVSLIARTKDREDQHITSTNIAGPYNTTDAITMTAVSDRGLTEFTYAFKTPATDAAIATINGDQLTFIKSGTISGIVVRQEGDKEYLPAELTTGAITVNKVTPTISTNPTATVTYGNALNSVSPTGGHATVTLHGVAGTEVAGTWAWKNPSQVITDAAGSHTYPIDFTPTSTGMYNSVEGTATVTVNKATPTLTVTNPAKQKVYLDDTQTPKLDLVNCVSTYSAENDTHEHAQAKSAINYTCTPSTGFVTGDKKFYATAEGTYTITATAPATDYYNPVEQTITIVVKKHDNPIVLKIGGTDVTSTTIDCESSTAVAISSKHTGTVYTVSPESSNGITASVSGSNVTFTAAAGSSNKQATFTIEQANTAQYEAGSATITISVKPIFRFAAVAEVGPTKKGTVSASVAETSKIENYGTTSSSTTATFSATPNTGYRFDGWYTSSDCTGSAESTDNPYTPTITNNAAGTTQTVTRYAKFTAHQHNLSWSTDGDPLTGNYTHGPVDFGTTIVQPATPTKLGYTFTGWSASVPTTMPDNDLSFTATWTPITYTVTFESPKTIDDGNTSSPQTFTYDVEQKLNKNGWIIKGSTFTGWNTQQDGSGIPYSDEQSVINLASVQDANITLYAQWTTLPYSVSFDGNGATSGTMDNYSTTFNTVFTLPANAYKKEYVVTFNANGGSCTTASLTSTATFMGWEDHGCIYYDGLLYGMFPSTNPEYESLTLEKFDAPYYSQTYMYGDFKYDKYQLAGHYLYHGGPKYNYQPFNPDNTLSLYPDQAEGMANLTTLRGDVVPLVAHWSAMPSITLPTPTLTQADFLGWYDAAVGGNKIGDAGASYTPTGAITLYAHWTVTVDPGQQQTAINITDNGTTVKTTTMTFAIHNSTAATDFSVTPASIVGAANGWEITGWEYTSTSLVTVNLKFTAIEGTTPKGNNAATIRLTANSGHSNTGTATANVNITPAYTCTIADNYKVDDAQLDLQSLWTSTGNGAITYSVERLTADGVSDAGHKTEVIGNRYLTLGEAGTWRLTLSQAAGTSSDANTTTKTITISKYTTTLSVLLGGAEQPNNTITLYYGDGIFVEPSSNSDALIEGTQLDEGVCGTYYHDPVMGPFYAAATSGTAHCLLTQAETYKYAAATLDFYVIVTTKTDGCDVLELKKGDLNLYGNAGPWPMSGPGGNIVYSLESDLELQVSKTENGTYTTIGTGNGTYDLSTSPYADYKYIRVRNTALGSRKYTVNAIPRNRFIKPSVTELSPKKVLLGSSATNTFDVSYSVCPGGSTVDGNVRIQSSNNQEGLFTVTPDNIKTETDATSAGTVTISAKYTPSKVGKDTTILAVYTRFDKKRVYVYAECLDKWTPTIAWQYGVDTKNIGMNDVTPEVKAYNDNNDELKNVNFTFTSSDESVATIVNGQIHPIKQGTVTITATIQANDTLFAASATQTFFVSEGANVKLDANGGTPDNTIHVAFMAGQLDQTPSMSRTGYTLNGFYTAQAGGTKVVNNNGTLVANTTYTDANGKWISIDNNVILYAQWTANTYTVTLDPNYEGASTKSVNATYGSAMPNTNALTRTGHAFQGYFDQQVDGTQYYSSTGTSMHTWDKANNTTLYAHWIGADFFTWNGGNALTFEALSTIPNNVATAFSGHAVSYSSSNSAVIRVNSDGTMTALTAGTATITATTAADPTGYFAVISEAKTFTVTKATQSIVWNQNFSNIELPCDPIALTAQAIDAGGAPTGATLTYTIANTSIAKVENGQLIALARGNTTITVTAKSSIYADASTTLLVVIRTAGDPCSTTAEVFKTAKTFNEDKVEEQVPERPYDTISFYVWKNLAVVGSMTAVLYDASGNQVASYPFNNDTVGSSKSKLYKFYIPNAPIVKTVSFVTSSAFTYFTVQDVKLKQAEYLTTNIKDGEFVQKHTINTDYIHDFEVYYSDKPSVNATITNHNGLEIVRQEAEIEGGCGAYGTYHYTVRSTYKWDEPRFVLDTISITTPVGDKILVPIQLTVEAGSSYYFVNSEKDKDWNNLQNWREGSAYSTLVPAFLPSAINQVVITDTVRVSQPVEVYAMEIKDLSSFKGCLIIAPTGGVTVYSGGVNWYELHNHLHIESSLEHTGYFKVMPKVVENWREDRPTITMQYATKATLDNGANKDAKWQYFGIPVNGYDFTVDYITWLNEWDETLAKGWIKHNNEANPVHMKPFHGYEITQYGQPVYEFSGPIIMDSTVITMTNTETGKNGDNIIANSFPAPIDVKLFDDDDFSDGVEKTFYIYNSGSWNQWKQHQDAGDALTTDAPGAFTAIPVGAAALLGGEAQTLIPPMQAICMWTENEGTIKLNYRKHVWYATASGTYDDMNKGLRAPARAVEQTLDPELLQQQAEVDADKAIRDSLVRQYQEREKQLSHRARITIYSENSGADHVYLLEKTGFTTDFDNGFDAYKMWAQNSSYLNVYAKQVDDELMSVWASDALAGTYLGLDAGDDETYSMKISSVIGDSLYLLDLTNNAEINLAEGQTYMFNAEPGSINEQRFIVKKREQTHVPTSLDPTNSSNVYIWTDAHNLHVENANNNSALLLYSADGKLIYSETIHRHATISIDHLACSMYLVYVDGKPFKFVKK